MDRPQLFDITISIHAPREGGDAYEYGMSKAEYLFQSTPPARGATRHDFRHILDSDYFNPRPPRGGRPQRKSKSSYISAISIHAPREGGDSKDAQFYLRIFDK